MRRLLRSELFVQAGSLAIAFLLVQSLYVAVVRPRAAADLAHDQAAMKADPTYVSPRSVWVLLVDYEQESEIVLMLWALAIMGHKVALASRERRLFDRDLLTLGPGMRILPQDAREHARQVQALPEEERDLLLPRSLLTALLRFSATGSIETAAQGAQGVCDAEADRLDSELSLLRYIAWAIPAIGFIGTVRGIGDALAQAHRAMQGDLSGVTQGLGTAFNSTLVALLLSLLLMFFLHHLQSTQEKLVRDAANWLDDRLVQNLRAA